ncbi:MAG: hypothetical protein ACL93V_17240 [Candidatus Electrothrix sp. YB6]
MQNIAAPIVNVFLSDYTQVALSLKEGIAFILILTGAVKFFKVKKNQYLYLLSIVYTLYCCVNWMSYGMHSLLSLRQLIIISSIIAASFYKVNGNFNYRLAHNYLIFFLFALMISNYAEIIYFHYNGNAFWYWLRYDEFVHSKGLANWLGSNGVPRGWYTWDFLLIGSGVQRRAVSFFIAQPTIIAHILAYPTLYFFFQKKYTISIVFLLSLLLTFSKGGVLAVILGVYINFSEKVRPRVIAFFSILFVVISSYILINTASYGNYYSASKHASGLVSAVHLILEDPFGIGIGNAGNFAKLDELTLNREEIGESYFGALISQTGLIGMFYYMFVMMYIFFTRFSNQENKTEHYVLAVYLFSTLCTGMMSESAINFVGLSPFILLFFYSAKNSKSSPAENELSYSRARTISK